MSGYKIVLIAMSLFPVQQQEFLNDIWGPTLRPLHNPSAYHGYFLLLQSQISLFPFDEDELFAALEPGVAPWLWERNLSLKTLVEQHLGCQLNGNPGSESCQHESPDYFTLCSMNRLVGFQVGWANNLLDHIPVRKLRSNGFCEPKLKRRRLKVPKFIRELAAETNRSLGLLIPHGIDYTGHWWLLNDDRDHRAWLLNQVKVHKPQSG
ncbi:hypothetical protein B0T25DRAFT_561496 [Lasiosphaeria hispida]|uniref:Uncharacterized protein n=1 Tax=Lasiosphaeria hispida TaxID=260671 RepID=A0AAJ0HTN8_9PEZI|nr:hypothetical protein B0T25DRAFT_561496 [Lasiosphaeria hispida]